MQLLIYVFYELIIRLQEINSQKGDYIFWKQTANGISIKPQAEV